MTKNYARSAELYRGGPHLRQVADSAHRSEDHDPRVLLTVFGDRPHATIRVRNVVTALFRCARSDRCACASSS
jgi:hypothetical protein